MIFSVVILSLAVLTAADQIEQKVQQEQVHEQKQPILPEQQPQVSDVNVIPFYKKVYDPYSLNLYSGYPKDRNFLGYSQKNADPFSLYTHIKNAMSYPYRNNFYLRYLNKYQPKVYYDTQDIYDYQQGYVNKPLADIPGYNQLISPKADLDASYDLPYSPSYYSQYNTHDQGYPLLNKYYGKNLDLGYPKSSSYNVYDSLSEVENMRKYFGRNLNMGTYPFTSQTINWWPSSNEELNLGLSKSKISRNLGSEFVKPTIRINDVDIELVKPFTSKYVVIGDHPTVSRQIDLEDLRNLNDGSFWSQDRDIGYISGVVQA